MPLARSHATSLQIPIPTTSWRARRPSAPRRVTFPPSDTTSTSPFCPMDPDAPSIPPTSYWDPDTSSPQAGSQFPASPINPFLSPPAPLFNQHVLFPIASPLLPASPLSIFDRAVSPTDSSVLRSSTPLTPRFLFPRTPPCPPYAGVRKRSVAELVQVEREKMKVEFYYFVAVRRRVEMECDEKWGIRICNPWKRLFGRKGSAVEEKKKKKERKKKEKTVIKKRRLLVSKGCCNV